MIVRSIQTNHLLLITTSGPCFLPSPFWGQRELNKIMRIMRILLLALAWMLAPYASAQTWRPTDAPATYWVSIAASSDGSKLVAAATGGFFFQGIMGSFLPGSIYTSTNSGLTWQETTAPSQVWQAVASSADGSKLAAVVQYGGIYTSTNSGESWTRATNAPTAFWSAIASSADGAELIAAIPGAASVRGAIYISTDSGITWNLTSAPTDQDWTSISASADGSNLLATAVDGWVYFSTNSGVTWTQASLSNVGWEASSVSSDGTTFVAAVNFTPSENGGTIYVSTNSGAVWFQSSAPVARWQAVASSADGKRLVAAVGRGGIYTSSDSGVSWAKNCSPDQNWTSVTSSVDGTKLVGVAFGGGIYMPMLGMSLLPSGIVLSWPTNSINFMLQQNIDLSLTKWADVTNPPTVNFTNLQFELTMTTTNGRGFFRLRTP